MYNQLLSRLFNFAWTVIAPAASVISRAGSRLGAARGAGPLGLALTVGAVAADLLGIDALRQEAVRVAPTSDPEALEEAARQIMRMTGADGTKTFWPKGPPRYYVIDLQTGNQWFLSRYINFTWVRNANRRGFNNGIRAGKREIATLSQAQAGGRG